MTSSRFLSLSLLVNDDAGDAIWRARATCGLVTERKCLYNNNNKFSYFSGAKGRHGSFESNPICQIHIQVYRFKSTTYHVQSTRSLVQCACMRLRLPSVGSLHHVDESLRLENYFSAATAAPAAALNCAPRAVLDWHSNTYARSASDVTYCVHEFSITPL